MRKHVVISLLLVLCMTSIALPAGAMNSAILVFGPFEAENLNTDEEKPAPVTEAIFKEADITLLNFWATWCGPCIKELPDLAQLSELTGGRVQVVGVLLDGLDTLGRRDESAIKAFQLLAEEAGVTYPVLLPDEFLARLGTTFQAVPTTLILDSKGTLQDTVVGSNTAEQWIAYAQKVADKVMPDAEPLAAK